jgi:CDP-diacylglycerol--glycerol-3-phosphate 3-phosphatidyltransferase
VIVAGVSDLLDGAIARGSGQASPRGAFFDSVSDRVSDALLLGGTAWYLLGQGSPYLSMLAFAVGACSMLISYERGARRGARARTRAAGSWSAAERFVFLSVAFAFDIVVPVLWIMLVLTPPPRVPLRARCTARPRTRRACTPRRGGRVRGRDERLAEPRRPAPLRTWWTARRLDGQHRRAGATRRRAATRAP